MKRGASDEQQEWIDYAFARCGKDCVTTWQAESGWVLLRPGNSKNKTGPLAGTLDIGLCQTNWQFHFDFIFDLSQSPLLGKLTQKEINIYKRSWQFTNRTMYNRLQKELDILYGQKTYSTNFKDPYKQLDRCVSIWDDAKRRNILRTTFYGYNIRRTAGVQKSLQFIYE